MKKEMVYTAVDELYTFTELEEHIREGILYDIMTKLNINESEALEIAKEVNYYNYKADITYRI